MAAKEEEHQDLRERHAELLEMFKMSAVANQWLRADEVMRQTEPDCELVPAVYKWRNTPKDVKEKTHVLGYLEPIQRSELKKKTKDNVLDLAPANGTKTTAMKELELSASPDMTMADASLTGLVQPSDDEN